mgnify:CR=1 FL=1
MSACELCHVVLSQVKPNHLNIVDVVRTWRFDSIEEAIGHLTITRPEMPLANVLDNLGHIKNGATIAITRGDHGGFYLGPEMQTQCGEE